MFVEDDAANCREVSVERQETAHRRPKTRTDDRQNDALKLFRVVVEEVDDRALRTRLDTGEVFLLREGNDVRFIRESRVGIRVGNDLTRREVDDDRLRFREEAFRLFRAHFSVRLHEARRAKNVELLVERLVATLQTFETHVGEGDDDRADDREKRRDDKCFSYRFGGQLSYLPLY